MNDIPELVKRLRKQAHIRTTIHAWPNDLLEEAADALEALQELRAIEAGRHGREIGAMQAQRDRAVLSAAHRGPRPQGRGCRRPEGKHRSDHGAQSQG